MKSRLAFLDRSILTKGWLADLIVCLTGVLLIASVLGIRFLNSANWPTGGDTASHLLYAKLYADEFLFSGQILPWMPEVFCGFPFLSYYFPLPFVVIALLSKLVGFAPAFKWGAFLAAMLLPGAVFTASRRWLGFSWPAALFGSLAALAFLLHEQNSIWGGNLLSTLSGEFAYSYSLFFSILAMMAWTRALHRGQGWLLAALLEAACCFSHGFPLLLLGFSSFFLLLHRLGTLPSPERMACFKRSLRQLLYGHLLAFTLVGGWLWPMLEMHGLTIPNDPSYTVAHWQELLPVTLWPVAIGGLIGLCLLALPAVRRNWTSLQTAALCYFVSAAGLSAVAFLIGDQLGLADIRFFPPVWLLGGMACGWLLGQALDGMARSGALAASWLTRLPRWLCAAALCLCMAGLLAQHVTKAPDWGFWNHSGLQAKPQWHNLSQLFPAMSGTLWSPRLVFEHDPDNNDLGSTRTLEALPMFLNHRPVLEGLYMESALLGPAIYSLQSEVSARPSSPLVRFPSGSLDPTFAARHMNFLHTDSVLLRSDKARQAIEASGLFEKTAEASPFALYRLKNFDSQLAQVVTQPIRIRPQKDWMQDAFAWYTVRSRFEAFLPVYADTPTEALLRAVQTPADNASPARVTPRSLDRHQLVFETEAVGRPHLIKMSYHPRWQLASQGSMNIAGSGFLLVVPEEREIRLVYGHTLIGKLGMLATALSAAFVLFLLLCRPASPDILPVKLAPSGRYLLPFIAAWIFLAVAGLYFAARSPDRAYKKAWELMRTDQFAAAGEQFEQAYRLRRSPAKKEEALFWQAKALERAGRLEEARLGYRELIEHFHGFWLPESLHTFIVMERRNGRSKEAEPFAQRLREEYPNNPWTHKLDAAQ